MGDEAPPEQKPFWEAIWPVLACGAGLFSDGYVNNVRVNCSSFPACVPDVNVPVNLRNIYTILTAVLSQVIGSVATVLGYQYGDVFKNSTAQKYVSDIAFAGTVGLIPPFPAGNGDSAGDRTRPLMSWCCPV